MVGIPTAGHVARGAKHLPKQGIPGYLREYGAGGVRSLSEGYVCLRVTAVSLGAGAGLVALEKAMQRKSE